MIKIKYRKANLLDVENMRKLVVDEVNNGIILDRSSDEIANTIRSYQIATIDSEIIGFVALHIHTQELAEIRSLIISDKYRKLGIASNLIKLLFDEASILKLQRILVLTYQDSFFKKFNFKEISKESIPEHKIWADCVKCKLFPICNEIALIKYIQ